LADVVDIVRNNFTSSRADLIQKITAYAVTRDRAVQGEKVSDTASRPADMICRARSPQHTRPMSHED